MPQLTIDWADAEPDRERARGMSGLEWLRGMVDGTMSRAPLAALVGMRFVAVDEGSCTFAITPQEQHTNPMGTVHGGVLATLLDTVTGVAVHTMLEAGVGYGTTDLHVRMVRAPRLGVEVTAEGRVVHLGRTTATSEGEAHDADGRLLATATAGCVVLRG